MKSQIGDESQATFDDGTERPTTAVDHQQLLEGRRKQSSFVREWIATISILFIGLGAQWQRYVIGYAAAQGTTLNDPKYEIATQFSEHWKQFYGILTGIAFTFTFAVFGIFGGVTADLTNRKWLIIITSICWSACTLISGLIPNFWIFLIMRITLGLFQAFMNPTAYSMIADFFPPERRTFANAVFGLSIYFGGAMASLSLILISRVGWRLAYFIISLFGFGTTIFGFFFIFNVERGRWNPKKTVSTIQASEVEKRSTCQKFLAAQKEIFTNSTSRWVAMGGFMRFFGGFSIAFFLPQFFSMIWSPDKSERSENFRTAYAISNAFVVSMFGFASSMIGGIIGDRGEQRGILMTKAYICIFSAVFGSIFFTLCVLIQIPTAGGFAFSISMLALEYLTAENWIAPAITMLVNVISAENKSFAVSAFLFFSTVGGTIATAIAQPLFNAFDVENYPERSGYILCALVLFSYLGSIPFFILAGRSYSAFKRKEMEEAEQANQGF